MQLTLLNQNKMNTIYNQLKQECDDAGVRLGTVCRVAGIDRSLLQKWKKQDPKTVQVINSFRKALEELKQASCTDIN